MEGRYLGNKDVEKWNKRLQSIDGMCDYKISISANSNTIHLLNTRSFGDIGGGSTIEDVTNHSFHNKNRVVNYNFSFSVITKRKSEFFKIVNLFMNEGICFIDESRKSLISKIGDISKMMDNPIISEHNIYNNNLTRYQYNLRGNIFDIIAVTTILEDAIDFFSKIWGYEEKSGAEVCLLKYPIGSVVSINEDKGADYMVNNYYCHRSNVYGGSNRQWLFIDTILYEIVCIESDLKSPIIKYGDVMILPEEKISPSRTNNINIILN